jgi:glycosyltransferase involved in cell wall biosynthesis
MAQASSLRRADALRDAGAWAEAAAAYAAWLAAHPEDWPIWVQHGHCVKEAGDPRAALASYRRAERGLPGDADLQVQIGHALKLSGDLPAARAAYAAALERDAGSDAAWAEIRVLPAPTTGKETGGAGPHLVFDLSDLLAWFDGARAPTGIQRVQMEIVGPALRRGGPAASVALAVFRPEAAAWRALPVEIFRRLAHLSRRGADPAEPAWQDAVAAARAALDAAPDLGFPPGGWLVNLGSSWTLPDYHRAVRAARARSGLRYAALLHDCGPVVVPEHSPRETTARFARWLSILSAEADLLLCASEATAADLARLRAAHLPGLPQAPVALLRPGAAPTPAPAAPAHPGAAALAGRPYVLLVSTVESRKDHLFVLHAWLALLRRRRDVPPLVLVGREGFGAAPALALLARAPEFEGRVLRLDDVPDAALPALYRGALFTLYNSAHEGWGLPVTEALAAGKAVVAPGHSALLESGAGLALHFRPGSEPAFLALVERLLDDKAFRAATEARIAAEFRPPSWQELADTLVARLAAAPPAAPAAAVPPPGTILRLGAGDAARPAAAMFWADRLREGPGWHAPEAWGCWTRPGRAVLRLPVAAPAGTRLRLHLGLRGAAEAKRVAVTAAGGRQVLEVPAEGAPVLAMEVVADGAALEVAVDAPGPEAGIGVVAAMCCAADDLAARIEFLERLRFVWVGGG